MKIEAYVFIEVSQEKSKEVCEKIKAIDGVRSAHSVTGPYDVIALVDAPDISLLGEFVVAKIQCIPGVNRTLTNVIAV